MRRLTLTMLASFVLAPCAYAISSQLKHVRAHERQPHVDPRQRATHLRAVGAIEAARQRVPVFRARLARARARVRPQPGHLAGWSCIHSREADWSANTGNGFYGGLQMSYGWAGRVQNAALLAPTEQIAIAEAEAAEHGWSYAWMRSQWPNTFPRCAGLFV
jgi:hypothetical protein